MDAGSVVCLRLTLPSRFSTRDYCCYCHLVFCFGRCRRTSTLPSLDLHLQQPGRTSEAGRPPPEFRQRSKVKFTTVGCKRSSTISSEAVAGAVGVFACTAGAVLPPARLPATSPDRQTDKQAETLINCALPFLSQLLLSNWNLKYWCHSFGCYTAFILSFMVRTYILVICRELHGAQPVSHPAQRKTHV